MDIDGTLVNDSHVVPDENIKALRKASELGVRLALISGRYPSGIRLVENQIGKECLMAANAGAYIFEGHRCLYSKTLSVETAFKIYRTAVENKGDCWFFSGENWYVSGINPWVETEIENVSARPRVASPEELLEIFDKTHTSPNKALVTGTPETVRSIYEILLPMKLDVRLGFSSPVYLEVTPPGIHKGFALEKLCELYNIPIDETIAFGDQDLDIPLLEKSGIGIAMANGVEALKKRADHITKSNNDSGIAYALKEILGLI